MNKKWIIETIEENDCLAMRAPKPGEYYLGLLGLTAYKAPKDPLISEPCVILHPIPDDVVMVPREKIEALRNECAFAGQVGFQLAQSALGRVIAVVRTILACAEPEKPKDEILEWMKARVRNEKEAIQQEPIVIKALDWAIALREKELKERGE